MISQRAELPIVKFSVRVYQTLLFAYPTKFEQEYGSEMMHVFQDCCLRTVRQGGAYGMAGLWAVTLLDLIQSVISEHAQKDVQMKKEMKPEAIRTAGWALIWGAVTFVIRLLSLLIGDTTVGNPFYGISALFIIFLSSPLLAVGMLGLRNRYGNRVGWFGKNTLLLGAILGPLTTLIGFFGMAGLFGRSNIGWHLTYMGPGVLFAGLTVFGIVALYKRPLPRWNMVPVIAGLWYSIAVLAHIIMGIRVGNWLHGGPMYYMMPYLDVIQGIALVALGYILKSDVPEEIVAPT
jgi:hypothetical protein